MWDLGRRVQGAGVGTSAVDTPLMHITVSAPAVQGHLAHEKTPTLLGPPETLGIGLR